MKKRILSVSCIFLLTLIALNAPGKEPAEPKVGVRPYELDWAKRFKEEYPPLIDFEMEQNWTTENKSGFSTFSRSREQQIWDRYVGKWTWRATGANAEFVTRPPRPIPVPKTSFDAMSCWIYGHNWVWVQNSGLPIVTVKALFRLPDGKEESYGFQSIIWKEWYLCYHHFSPAEQRLLNQDGVTFVGFKLLQGSNKIDASIYFDNFALFKEKFKPLEFTKRARRGIDMFPGQDEGQNTGEGRLPFPNREETILPTTLDPNAKNSVAKNGDAFEFLYEGADGKLTLSYEPKLGTLSDMKARWNDSEWFLPLSEAGINELINAQGQNEKIEKRTLLDAKLEGTKVIARWRFASKSVQLEMEYNFQMLGKSLLWDTFAKGGNVGQVEFGKLSKIENPGSIKIPYYSYYGPRRPFALMFQPKGSRDTLFYLAQFDWYRSNASDITGRKNGICYESSAISNGELVYKPKTDGKRNDVYERFFITMSPRFEEVLPNIPNPISPWKQVAGSNIWTCEVAANSRKVNCEHLQVLHRLGLRKLIITDHETCWRDEGESFTFRTEPAPKKGGDKGWYDYTRYVRDKLGYIYGPYNNFTDFAPVNGFWSFDMVVRTSDNQLLPAWARNYAPKATRAVEFCEKLTPIIQSKFNFNTAYCDVHTATPPWSRTDYDARTPGGGTFAAVYYAYGEIMLIQKKNWNGPVYSEGPHHCFYSGLTDGNYAQDRGYYFPNEPWLIDFDLLKIHDHECNIAMGYTFMYDPKIQEKPYKTNEEKRDTLDQYFAAIIAFGHPGILVRDTTELTMKSYYMIRAIASYYTQSSVKSIFYQDKEGKRYRTSQALQQGLTGLNHLVVIYQDGTFVAVNGNRELWMTVRLPRPLSQTTPSGKTISERTISLPPNSFIAFSADQKVLTTTKTENGNRFDYSTSPEAIFINGRGHFQMYQNAACSSYVACRFLENGDYEVINPANECCGFQIRADKAIAYTIDGKESKGKISLRHARGLLFVVPVSDGYRYLLTRSKEPVNKANDEDFVSDSIYALPGQKVSIWLPSDPKKKRELRIPEYMKPGALFWAEPEKGKWIFFVIPESKSSFSITDNQRLDVTTKTSLPVELPLEINLRWQGATLSPVSSVRDSQDPSLIKTTFDLGKPGKGTSEKGELILRSGSYHERVPVQCALKEELLVWKLDLMSDNIDPSKDLNSIIPKRWAEPRHKKPHDDLVKFGANIHVQAKMGCNDIKRDGWFMHPVCRNGVGAVYMDYELTIPKNGEYQPFFKAFVGKQDGSSLGDGILFKVEVLEEGKPKKLLSNVTVTKHEWLPIEADLSPWIGKPIRLRLTSDPGLKNDTNGDWACWGDLKIESNEKGTFRSLQKTP